MKHRKIATGRKGNFTLKGLSIEYGQFEKPVILADEIIQVWFKDRPILEIHNHGFDLKLNTARNNDQIRDAAREKLQKVFDALETLRQVDLLTTWHGEIYQDLKDNWGFEWLVNLYPLKKVSNPN